MVLLQIKYLKSERKYAIKSKEISWKYYLKNHAMNFKIDKHVYFVTGDSFFN